MPAATSARVDLTTGIPHHVDYTEGRLRTAFSQTSQTYDDAGAVCGPESPGDTESGEQTSFEAGDRTGGSTSGLRVLQPAICCPQGYWRLPSGHRLVDADEGPQGHLLQDGDTFGHPSGVTGQPLGYNDRPVRHLFSCPSSSSGQAVSPLHGRRPCLAVPSPALRAGLGTFPVYYDRAPSGAHIATSWGPDPGSNSMTPSLY